MIFSKTKLASLVAAIGVLSAPLAYALTPCYTLLAPVGTFTSSGCYTLTAYLNGIFTTVIGIAGILAVVMIVICAVRLMSTPSVSGRSEAKECIYNAIFGVLIAIGSWLLLNTINPQLLKNDAEITVQASSTAPSAKPPSTTQTQPPGDGCYFKYLEISSGNTLYTKTTTGEMCEVLRMDARSDANKTIQSSCFCVKNGTAGAVSPTSPPPVSSVSGSITCPTSGLNLCEPQYRQCTNPQCAQFASWVSTYASRSGLGADAVGFMKALIVQESSCVARITDAVGFDGLSGGPTHLIPSTASKFKSQCSVPDNTTITVGWLADKANWEKDVCLSAEYIKTLTSSACGSDIRNVAAGYNGGSGACAPSGSCSGDTNCAGNKPPMKWECVYDDNAHQQCNAGYNTTRNYATKVLYCTKNPGY